MNSLGQDFFTLLAASVFVVPISTYLNVTPVLGFLAVGCAIGPYGLELFSNTEADLRLGDFGILFLLFNEGLNLSPDRLKALGAFFRLGAAQLLLSVATFFFFSFYLGPKILPGVETLLPQLDDTILQAVRATPVAAFCVAAAGSLSSSAFVLPVLKGKGWEDEPEGVAALSILLLQDLAVAPLLVLLPLVAGAGASPGVEGLELLAFKATIGFGGVLALGNQVLKVAFDLVAEARSTETFVAATLLVAVGMGRLAEAAGLSATTGAFAAGVLLAGNRYRAQIAADIKPFEGILLGVFFMTAGAGLDPQLVLSEAPTLALGIFAFLLVKAAVVFAAGPALGLDDLGVLEPETAKLLAASVILSMSLTPILGELADVVGRNPEQDARDASSEDLKTLFDRVDADQSGTIELDELRVYVARAGLPAGKADRAFELLDADGDGNITLEEWVGGLAESAVRDLLRPEPTDGANADAVLVCGYGLLGKAVMAHLETAQTPCVAIDLDPGRVASGVLEGRNVVFGDGANLDVLTAAGVTKPRAVVVAYAGASRRLEATTRLRRYFPDAPIFARARGAGDGPDAAGLATAGATAVVAEVAEASLRLASLVGVDGAAYDAAAAAARASTTALLPRQSAAFRDLADSVGATEAEVAACYETFAALDGDGDGTVTLDELERVLLRAATGPVDEARVAEWVDDADVDGGGGVEFPEYARATFAARGGGESNAG
ncbi:solute:proton antiporter [Aureococcus anophagefferens]|nr:solute:proton antiporter [Aureococcus anophagefferens]